MDLPKWLAPNLFTHILIDENTSLLKIKKFKLTPALDNIENSITNLIRISIKIKFKDKTSKKQKFILKIPNCHEYHELFLNENDMYNNIIPELENICKGYDTSIKFKANHFNFNNSRIDCDYILMEDLCWRGFKNLQRLNGLNEVEVKLVLQKLAQWHAASMKRVENVGEYDNNYIFGHFIEDERELIENMHTTFERPFLLCLKSLNLEQSIKKQVIYYMKNLTELYLNFGKVNSQQLNVLNHGDLWLNNLMFSYNDSNTLLDVLFIDFQMPKYGNPAQDLFWFLLSSPAWDIKLEKFEEFIAFYHGSLLSFLRLYNYQKTLPTINDLNERLREGGVWAFITVQRLLPIVLMDPHTNINIVSFLSSNLEGSSAKTRLYFNPLYIVQLEKIILWLIDKNYISL